MAQSELEASLLGQIRMLKLPEPETQYRFTTLRRWRFDLAYPDRRVAVEVDGGTWVGGRHTRGEGFEKDCEKTNEAAIQGWLVLRVTGAMIDDGRGITYLERALKDRAA